MTMTGGKGNRLGGREAVLVILARNNEDPKKAVAAGMVLMVAL